jgi:hypothetical protein
VGLLFGVMECGVAGSGAVGVIQCTVTGSE